jgi:quinol monooxygenase YgiN
MAALRMLVRVVANEGQSDALCALLQTLQQQSQQEEGVVQYEVVRDIEASDTFYLQEAYADKDAFKAHARSEHMAAYLKASEPLLKNVNMHKVKSITD